MLVVGGSAASADRLRLRSGATLTVAHWWVEGETLYYETESGTIGLAKSDVVAIDRQASEPEPQPRPAAIPKPDRTVPTTASAAPPSLGVAPTLKQLDEGIGSLSRAASHAGTTDDRERIEAKLADLYVLRARQAVQNQRRAAAYDDYDKALDLSPNHRVARAELAWLWLEDGHAERALSLVLAGLAATPQDPALLVLHGEILYRDNRLPEALADYRAALAAGAKTKGLAERIEQLQRELATEGEHRRRESQHFVLSFDGDRDDSLGHRVLDSLESAWSELTRELDVWPSAPISVVLYTRREFESTTAQGPDVLGLFDGKIRLPVGGLGKIDAALQRVFRHELTHALLHVKGRGAVPRWLHEGIAQLMEPRAAEAVRTDLLGQAEAGTLALEPFSYPKSLSFCAYLDQRLSRARLLWLVDRLAEGQAENDAFQGAFGLSQEELVDGWRRELQRGN